MCDGVLYEREAAQLASDEKIPDGRFILRRQRGHVGAHAGSGHHHGDGTDRADIGAQAVPDAFETVYDRGFAGNHAENVAFGADRYAGGAADAVFSVNVRVLRARTFGMQSALCGGFLGSRCFFFHLRHIAEDEESENRGGDQECSKSIHCTVRPIATNNPASSPSRCEVSPKPRRHS